MTIKEYEALWKDCPPCPFAVGDRVTFKNEYENFTHDQGGWVFVQVLLRRRNLSFLTISNVNGIYICFKEVQEMFDSSSGGFSYVPFKLIQT
jgi:hypothetical protein